MTSLKYRPTFDPAFGEGGRKLYDVGGPNDWFSGVAPSLDGSRIAAVGHLGPERSGRDKDDGAVLRLTP